MMTIVYGFGPRAISSKKSPLRERWFPVSSPFPMKRFKTSFTPITLMLKSDFESDEKGEINKDIDRSILAEDTLYNLLDEIHELRDSLREFVDSIRYPSDDEKEEK